MARGVSAAAALVLAATLAHSACTDAPSRTLRDVPLPDLSRMDAPVQAQARDRHAAIVSRLEADAGDADLGAAYGELAMILHAAEHLDAAEPAYLNAQQLMPDDARWPYFLGHLYKTKGDTSKSMASFTRALELRPTYVAGLVWLGRLHLQEGRPEDAEPLFARAREQAPRTVAVLAGLGQVALARRDYRRAADLLEEALAIDPGAASVHSPLALAYRALGDAARAEDHLQRWRNTEILVPDPLRLELDLALQSGLSYELRGVRAMEARDFARAAGFFRQGLELTAPDTPLARSLRHKLGTAMFLSGDARGAVEQFEAVVQQAPSAGLDEPAAKAHYSLGIVRATTGQSAEAIEHLTASVRFNPTYVEARIGLADALRRTGRVEASLPHYAEAVRLNPRAADARLGYAMGLVRLRRYAEAREWLTEATRAQPDRPEFAHALARLLAAAPDPRVRDGRRALQIVKELFDGQKTTALGETMAMTVAELGSFDEAVAIQRGVIRAAREAGLTRDVERMTENLRLYERGQPCRTPWRDDDVAHNPGPPVTPGLLEGAIAGR